MMNWNKVAGKLLEHSIKRRDDAEEMLGNGNISDAQNALIVSELLLYFAEALREGANNGE